jgi:hypothetical protein
MFDVAVCADESGIHDSASVCLLAGYITGMPSWRRFEHEWESVLQRYDVLDFHAKDFFAVDPSGTKTGKYRRGSDPSTKAYYAEWPLRRYTGFLEDLLGVIASSRLVPIGAMVQTKDFFSYTYGERRWLTGGFIRGDGKWMTTGAPNRPYHLLFDHILVDAAHKTNAGKKILYVFDQQKAYESRAIQQFGEAAAAVNEGIRTKFGAVNYVERHEAPGVQVADLYVHCWHRYATNPQSVMGLRRMAMNALTQKTAGLLHYSKNHMDGLLAKVPPEVRALLMEAEEPSQSYKQRLS